MTDTTPPDMTANELMFGLLNASIQSTAALQKELAASAEVHAFKNGWNQAVDAVIEWMSDYAVATTSRQRKAFNDIDCVVPEDPADISDWGV